MSGVGHGGGSWIGSGGASIGGAVTGGTDGSVLFVHPDGTLTQDNSAFFYVSGAGLTLGTNLFVQGVTVLDSGQISTDGAGGLTVNGSAYVSNQLNAGDIVCQNNFSSDGGNFASDGTGGVHLNTLYMGGYIRDVSLLESIDPNSRLLYNSSTAVIGDWSGSTFVCPNGLSVSSGTTIIQSLSNNGSISSDAGQFVTSAGRLSIYNGNATDGNGVVSVLKSINLTAQSASIASTNIIGSFTPAAGSHYRISAYLVDSVAGTGTATVTVTLGWNDGIAARTVTSSPITFGSLAAPVTLSQFMVINNTSPTYSTTVTGTAGTSKYELHIDCEKLK